MGNSLKVGTAVEVFVLWPGAQNERGTVCRSKQAPLGYVPIRFADGGRLLVPAELVKAVSP